MSKNQRRKAGVKAASSSKASEFLSTPGLITFESFDSQDNPCQENANLVTLKKLWKRDPYTREKALRELIEQTTPGESATVLATYNHFASLFDKIALDCQPIVRLLSMRLVGRQISVLNKKAEKRLKTILPYLFLGTCDTHCATSEEAQKALNENFPEKKQQQAIELVLPSIIQLLNDILITGDSALFNSSNLLKNEEEESPEERKARICEQAVVLAAKLSREGHREAQSLLLSYIQKFDKKNVNKIPKWLVKAQLSLPDAVSHLSVPAMLECILVNLNSADGELSGACADSLVCVLRDDGFCSSRDVSSLLPRILSAVQSIKRWSGVGSRLLPLLCSVTSSIRSSRSSFISKWFKALDVPPEGEIQEWQKAVIECIMYILGPLGPERDEQEEALVMTARVLQVSCLSPSLHSPIVDLIFWILSKQLLSTEREKEFVEGVCFNLMSKWPSSRGVVEAVLSRLDDRFVRLWNLFTDDHPVSLLEKCQDTHLLLVHQQIGLFDILEKEGSASSLFLRLLRLAPAPSKISASRLLCDVLEEMEDVDWERLRGSVDNETLFLCLLTWQSGDKVSSAAHQLLRLPLDVREELIGRLVDSDCRRTFSFLLPVVSSLSLGEEVVRVVGDAVVADIFSAPSVPSGTLLGEVLSARGEEVLARVLEKVRSVDGGQLNDLTEVVSILHSTGVLTDSFITRDALSFLQEADAVLRDVTSAECGWSEDFSPSSLSFHRLLRVAVRRGRWSLLLRDWFPLSTLLFPLNVACEAIQLIRRTVCFLENVPEEEATLLDEWRTLRKSGDNCVNEVLSSLCPYLVPALKGGRFLVWNGLPSLFSSPSADSLLDFQFGHQLVNGRRSDVIIGGIIRLSRDDLFTLQSDEVIRLSLVSFACASNDLPPDMVDFVLCGLVTAFTSCDELDEPSKWDENRRKTLATAALRCALHYMQHPPGSEWTDFYLPSLSSIASKWSVEVVRGEDAFSRYLFRFLSLLDTPLDSPCISSSFSRLDPELDSIGYDRPSQTVMLVALDACQEDTVYVAGAASILSRLARDLYEKECCSMKEEDGPIPGPVILRRLALMSNWCPLVCLHVVLAVVGVSGEAKDALSSIVRSALSTAFVQCENSPWETCCLSERPSFWKESYVPEWGLHTLFRIFAEFPSTVRMWFSALPKGAIAIISRWVTTYMHKELVALEMKRIRDRETKGNNSLVIRTAGNEVHCEYAVEETTMRLQVLLPALWPLVHPTVQVEGVVVGSDRSRRWLLQLNAQLYRNASVLEAITRWQTHVDRSVDGADACTICMALLAPQTRQLPKAKCRQCKNKFHSSCLFKWFESSRQSSCPLCRADFTQS